jgi:hypothetical protein
MFTPIPDLKHILSTERLPFSLTYFGSLGLTLYFAIGVRFHPFLYPPLPPTRYKTATHPHIPTFLRLHAAARPGRRSPHTQLKSTILTLLSAIVQVCALLVYLAAYFPGGMTTLRFGGQMGESARGLGLYFGAKWIPGTLILILIRGSAGG